MAEQPTTTTPPVPEWAEKAIDAFGRIPLANLTPAEQSLIDAVWLSLRARFGLATVITDPDTAVRTLVRDALAALDAEVRS
jgi:hypothetical protein